MVAEQFSASPASGEDFDQLQTSLQELGYRDESGYLVQSVAKFWFGNRLGPLTVYPSQAACAEAFSVLQNTKRRGPCARYRNDLAFFLPTTSHGKMTRQKRIAYGGARPMRVFKGGGPFVIKDSEGMVAEALRKMGYMDETFNNDLPEALFVFVNRPDHKSTLRKTFDALPTSTDTAVDVKQKLRHAFLSNYTQGRWVVAPKDTEVRQTLCKHGFLTNIQAPQAEALQAMQSFVRSRGLREMRSYNGLVFNIQQHIYNKDPDRVGSIEFKI
ncbi:unnamed protein product [Symbiodinium sp. CCMP2456]|nr:unnamed protein product [Symbiodinium sp. CCMP2456]